MSSYVTARRVREIGARLDAGDRELIGHVAVAKVLTGTQLRHLMDASSESQRRQLRRRLHQLTSWRVLARLQRRIGGVRRGSDSYVYALDVAGHRLHASLPDRQWRRPWTPSVRTLDHALAVSDLYMQLIGAQRHRRVELVSFATEPACWRSFAGPGGARQTLKSDAHLVIASGDVEHHAWVEVDRASESLPWIATKARTYKRYFDTGREQHHTGVFPQTLWTAPDQRRASDLVDTFARLPADQWALHHVTTHDSAVDALIATLTNPNGDPIT